MLGLCYQIRAATNKTIVLCHRILP